MSKEILDAKTLRSMLIGGTENMRTSSAEINDLNVFPVPDGDTGTNMTMTLDGGLTEIINDDDSSVGDLMDHFARGVLLGARGNSGVILSQILAGITDSLKGCETVDARTLAEAYRGGIKKSYDAVRNPTEGTILTVFRESTEYAAANIDEHSTIDDFYRLHIEEAQRSLARTKDILPVLTEADVVDSGGAGYLAIAVGMYLSLTGKMKVDALSETAAPRAKKVDLDAFTRDSVLEFGYCTEFLLRLTTAKVDPDNFEVSTITDELTAMGGDSIVAYKNGDIVKVHVHTRAPGEVLNACQRYGEFLTLKIENMSLEHNEEEAKKREKPKKREKLSVLAVASGDGVCALFGDMGASGIISGGQTANPSTEEFIEAFRRYDAEDIIVLPNNKNVFLAANQAAELYDAARVHIVPTKNLMQGYAALSVITPGITDIDTLVRNATRAASEVVDCEVTRAVRHVTIGGKEINEGDYIAISGGEIVATDDSARSALLSMLSGLDMDDYEIITVFAGAEVTPDERADLIDELEELYPDHEVIAYEGGQEIYDYYVAVE